MAEWLKAPLSKSGKGESPSGVRISPSPQYVNSPEIGAIFDREFITLERRGIIFLYETNSNN